MTLLERIADLERRLHNTHRLLAYWRAKARQPASEREAVLHRRLMDARARNTRLRNRYNERIRTLRAKLAQHETRAG